MVGAHARMSIRWLPKEAKRASEEKALAECAELVLNDSPDICLQTHERREAYIDEWRE